MKGIKCMRFSSMVEALNFDHLFILSSHTYLSNNYRTIDWILNLELGAQDLNLISITYLLCDIRQSCFFFQNLRPLFVK